METGKTGQGVANLGFAPSLFLRSRLSGHFVALLAWLRFGIAALSELRLSDLL